MARIKKMVESYFHIRKKTRENRIRGRVSLDEERTAERAAFGEYAIWHVKTSPFLSEGLFHFVFSMKISAFLSIYCSMTKPPRRKSRTQHRPVMYSFSSV